jgi:hypothetical protein
VVGNGIGAGRGNGIGAGRGNGVRVRVNGGVGVGVGVGVSTRSPFREAPSLHPLGSELFLSQHSVLRGTSRNRRGIVCSR